MENSLISIIVPVYNVEKYIDKCINSLINQSYCNIEIILIDDGSTDSSYEKCINFSDKDNRIKLYHKENEGVSSARNLGLKYASGNYISFVDSDDFIEKNMYEAMYNIIIEKNADVAICNYNKIKGKDIKEKKCEFSSDKIKGTEVLNKIYNYKTMGVLWNKLFKRQIIKCTFREDIHFCEDVLFLTEIFKSDCDIAVLSECYYNYIENSDSVCNSSFSDKKYSIVEACKQIYAIMENNRIHKSALYFIITKFIYAYINIYISDNLTDKEIKLKQLIEILKRYLFKSDVSLNLKARILLAFMFPKSYLKYRRRKKNEK